MGSIRVASRADRDKLHDYLMAEVGAGLGGRDVSSGGAPPNCYVSHSKLSDSALVQIAKRAGIKATSADRRARLHDALDRVMDARKR